MSSNIHTSMLLPVSKQNDFFLFYKHMSVYYYLKDVTLQSNKKNMRHLLNVRSIPQYGGPHSVSAHSRHSARFPTDTSEIFCARIRKFTFNQSPNPREIRCKVLEPQENLRRYPPCPPKYCIHKSQLVIKMRYGKGCPSKNAKLPVFISILSQPLIIESAKVLCLPHIILGVLYRVQTQEF